MEQFGGVFPREYKEILSLKGIGEYTAAAIVSFVWNKPYPVVDGNVYRVLSRLYAVDTPIDSTLGKKKHSSDRHRQTVSGTLPFAAIRQNPSVPPSRSMGIHKALPRYLFCPGAKARFAPYI